jgi:hypothetical protein
MAFARTGPEQPSGLGEQMAVARAQQAVIADFDKAVGQDVLQETPNEFFGTHHTVSRLGSGRGLLLKRDGALLELQETVIADGHPKDIWCELPEGCLATADRLTVHNPVRLPDWRIHQRVQGGFCSCVRHWVRNRTESGRTWTRKS